MRQISDLKCPPHKLEYTDITLLPAWQALFGQNLLSSILMGKLSSVKASLSLEGVSGPFSELKLGHQSLQLYVS
jgi:hypothetical protein